MALFTNKADAKRPLLTKVCQLDLGDRAEVCDFIEAEGISVFAHYARIAWDLPVKQFLNEDTPAPQPEEMTPEELEKSKAWGMAYLRRIFDRLSIAQRVMHSLANGSAMVGGDIIALNEYFPARYSIRHKPRIAPVSEGIDGTDHFTADISYPLSSLYLVTPSKEVDSLAEVIMRDLKKIVEDALHGPYTTATSPVSLCPECGNPFVLAGAAGLRRGSTKDTPRYCSYRCDHRAQGRERYSALFSDKKTP